MRNTRLLWTTSSAFETMQLSLYLMCERFWNRHKTTRREFIRSNLLVGRMFTWRG